MLVEGAPNKLPTRLGGDIPPLVFFRVLLKDEAHLEDSDGWLGAEEETIGKKCDNWLPRVGMTQK